jgi:TonB family protein
MPITIVHIDNPAPPPERRHYIRQKTRALAYLDIGADNGGIILDLCEEGLAFQAVAPLDSRKDVSLRLQLPGSRTRIKTGAQIIWLRESNRQGGVRFVDTPLEGRAQIREWIQLMLSPNAGSAEIPGPKEAARETQKSQETTTEPRRDKWLTLMARHEALKSSGQVPSREAEIRESASRVSDERKTAPEIRARRFVLDSIGHRAKPAYDVPQFIEGALPETPSQSVPESPSPGPISQLDRQNNDNRAITATTCNRVVEVGIPDCPTPTSHAAPAPTPFCEPSPLSKSAETSASGIESNADLKLVVANTIPDGPAAGEGTTARIWAGGVVLLAFFSILSFGIGRWVARRSAIAHSVQTPLPGVVGSIINPVTTENNGHKPNKRSTAIARKASAKHDGVNPTLEKLKGQLALLTRSPLVPPVEQNVQSTPTKQNLTALTGTNPLGSSPAPAFRPDESAPAVPPLRIVAGRTLKPTDRFNPCHLTYRVEPAYPLEAQQQRIEGAVKIHLVIGADGTIGSLKLLSGPPLLVPAAMDAAKYWRYLPALLNGQPVETEQDIEINFRLPH